MTRSTDKPVGKTGDACCTRFAKFPGNFVVARLGPLVFVGLSLSGCHKPLASDECNRLLDHYVELLVSSDRPGTSAVELVKLKKEARAKAAHDRSFLSCSSEVSRSQYDCAMGATTADKLEQCML
jgi:hypothetical protein